MIGNDAFQEADTVGITRPCTKHNYLVKKAEDLARVMHEAFHVAASGRPGPVVVDLPKNIQMAKAPYFAKDAVKHRTYHPRTEPDLSRIEEAPPSFWRGPSGRSSMSAAASSTPARRLRPSSPNWCVRPVHRLP